MAVDDHAPCEPDIAAMQGIRHLLAPHSNLLVQSAVVAGARRFVGTYGGFAYLAPLCGVPAVSYYTRTRNLFDAASRSRARCAASSGRPDLLEVVEVPREAAGEAGAGTVARADARTVGEQWGTWRQQWAVERDLERAIDGSAPILAGPWLSEVGYEVLYWVPFLRWVKAAYRIPDERIVVDVPRRHGQLVPRHRRRATSRCSTTRRRRSWRRAPRPAH